MHLPWGRPQLVSEHTYYVPQTANCTWFSFILKNTHRSFGPLKESIILFSPRRRGGGAQGARVVGPFSVGLSYWSDDSLCVCHYLPSWWELGFCGHCGTEAAVGYRGIPWDHVRPLGCPWRWTWLVGRCAGKGGGRTVSPPPSSQAWCCGGSPRFLEILG